MVFLVATTLRDTNQRLLAKPAQYTERPNQLGPRCAAQDDTAIFERSVHESYDGLKPSVDLAGTGMPPYQEVKAEVRKALLSGHSMITKVNTDGDIEALLDEDGQLRLRPPLI